MKSSELRKQIELIEAELEAIHPVSDAELEAQVAAGADADTLVGENDKRAMRRRVLSIKISALQKKLGAAIKAEAQPDIDKALKARQTAIDKAGRALGDAQAAIDALETAIKAWETSAADASTTAMEANGIARQAGIEQPVQGSQIGIGSSAFYEIDKRVFTILRPHRRDGSQLGKLQITPQETY